MGLGILTAISPCPLASNIAAISFLGQKAEKKQTVLTMGILYAAGRSAAYVALGVGIIGGLLKATDVSRFLQLYMNQALGPLLIILGLVLLGWVGKNFSLSLGTNVLQKKAELNGPLWAGPIGFLFAFSFCPVSAGLFFGGLIPLALNNASPVILPMIYGIGTSLPVVGFTLLMVFGSGILSKTFSNLTRVEKWIRSSAGTVFILVGIYYCLVYIYGLGL